MRICFFGDSFVNGTGDDDGLGWVGRVVAEARRRGRDLTAYNLGIRGNTSADVAARWEGEARLRVSADVDGRLVFSFGANDCASKGPRGEPRVARAQTLAHAESILVAARRWLPTLMIGPGVMASDHEANARIRALSAAYAELCERIVVPYFDIGELLLASPTWTEEALAGDGAHPNRGGYAIVADAVSKWRPWRDWMSSEVRAAPADRGSISPEQLEALLRRVYVDGGFTDPKIAATQFAAQAVFERGRLLVTRDGHAGKLTGMVIVVPPDSPARRLAARDEVEMQLLAVSPEHRQGGIGRALVAGAIELARSMGFAKMVLWTQPTMKDAHRLYERFGFARAPARDFEHAARAFWVFEKNL